MRLKTGRVKTLQGCLLRMNHSIDILTASYFEHVKAAEEFGKIGLFKQRDRCLEEVNKIGEKIKEKR